MSEFELRRRLKELPRERDPSLDLWPGIVARLGAQPLPQATNRPRFARVAGLAAALAVAVTGAWLGLAMRGQDAGGARAARDASSWPLAQADAMAESYRGAFAASLGGEQRAALARYVASPDVLAAERELDAAQRQIVTALREDPDSVYLLDLLRQTHSQRARLYRPAIAVG